MAGAKVEIQFDDAQALAKLQRAQDVLDGDGLRATLTDIGEYMLRATRDRAATETGPDGEAWPALSPRYARRKAKLRPGLPMLKFDNHMLGDQFTYQIEGDTLFVGTMAPYGARQQFGGGGIHARPWLGASDADAQKIGQITLDHIQAAIGDASPGEAL